MMWKSERRGDGGQRDGTVVEIGELEGCGDQREWSMVEVRGMGRWWSKGDQEVRKRIEDGMKEDEKSTEWDGKQEKKDTQKRWSLNQGWINWKCNFTCILEMCFLS